MKFLVYCLLYFSMYVLLYDPRLVLTGMGLSKVMIVLVFILCLSILSQKFMRFRLNKSFVFCCLSFLLILVVLQFLAQIRGGDNFYFRTIISVITVHIPLAIMCSYLLRVMKIDLKKLFEMIAVLCFLQGCFIFIDWLSSGGTTMKQSFFSSIVLQPESTEGTYRVSGFSSIAGDGLSFVQYIGVIMAFYLSIRNENSRRTKRVYGFMCFWIFFTLILVGRTGVVLSILFIFLFYLSPEGLMKTMSIGLKVLLITSVSILIGLNFIKIRLFYKFYPMPLSFFITFMLLENFTLKAPTLFLQIC